MAQNRSMPITQQQLGEWLDAYFAAWRSNEAADVGALFAEDAVYSYGPFREPARGRPQIVANWVSGGAPLAVESRYEILAVNGDTGSMTSAQSWAADAYGVSATANSAARSAATACGPLSASSAGSACSTI